MSDDNWTPEDGAGYIPTEERDGTSWEGYGVDYTGPGYRCPECENVGTYLSCQECGCVMEAGDGDSTRELVADLQELADDMEGRATYVDGRTQDMFLMFAEDIREVLDDYE